MNERTVSKVKAFEKVYRPKMIRIHFSKWLVFRVDNKLFRDSQNIYYYYGFS